MALIFTLWIIVLLTAVAFEMSFKGHLRAQLTATVGDTTKAFFLARAGVEKALADLASMESTLQAQFEMREDGDFLYQNIELGEGSYTLYVGEDEDAAPLYGMLDESSKLNVNTADASVLEKLPGLEGAVAASIAAFRQDDPFHDLDELLLIEGMDRTVLYGEDQNGNGILDPNEDDGDQGWPHDNSDGRLDLGVAAYLTTWSASLERTAEGEDRVDITTASAENISNSIDEISLQQAQSIVAHRGNNEFSSVLDLYDVELVEQIQEEGQRPEGPQPQNQPPQPGNASRGERGNPEERPQNEQRQGPPFDPRQQAQGDQGRNSNNAQTAEGQDNQTQPTTRSTGRKAFDEDAVAKIADLLTVETEEVSAGLVNINTASLDVIACLPGLDESMAGAIVDERRGREGGFTTVMELLSVAGMSREKLKALYKLVAVRSDVFTVRSFGVLGRGTTHVGVSAVVDRTGSSAKILYWREHE